MKCEVAHVLDFALMLEIEALQTEVTDEDIGGELQKLQDQNSLVVEKEDGLVENDSIVSIDHVELDGDGKEIQSTRREAFVFQVGTKYNVYEIDEEIVGMKMGEEKDITKYYPTYFEKQQLAGKEVRLRVKMNSVKVKQLPDIDDELAQDISDKFETLDDLKQDIRTRLEGFAQTKVRDHKIEQALKKIVADSEISLPKSLVETQAATQWQGLVERYGGNEERLARALQDEGKTKEQLIDSYRSMAEESQKVALVVTKMIEKEGIEVSEEEFEAEIKRQAELANMEVQEMEDHVAKQELKEDITFELKRQKLWNLLLEQATVIPGAKVKLLDLTQGNC